MNISTFSKFVSAAALGLAATISGVSHAGSYSETFVRSSADGIRATTVSFADLDLSSGDGQQVLTYRLNRAATAVCGSDDYKLAGNLRQANRNRDCRDAALDRAMSEISGGSLAVVVQR